MLSEKLGFLISDDSLAINLNSLKPPLVQQAASCGSAWT
jgi:hypothetical protein